MILNKHRGSACAVVAVFLVGAMASCSTREIPEQTVVATTSWPVTDLVSRLLEDDAAIHVIAASQAEAHDLELNAQDVAAIRGSETTVYVGADFQPAVEAAIEQARDIDVLGFAGELRSVDGSATTTDPHVWLDPVRWAGVTEGVGAALSERLANERISGRAAAMAIDIDALHEEFVAVLRNCRSEIVVTEHSAFGYLTDRYGFQEHALTGVSDEGEATAESIFAATKIVRENKLAAVFKEKGSNGRLAQTLAQSAGVKVLELDPLETPGGSYLSRMRANLEAITQGLECS